MEYNTTRAQMVIPEYGRNVQKMIQYLCTIDDRERRTKAAKFVINVMGQLYPAAKETSDFKHKLWDHMYIISDFKLDVDAPYPPPPPLSTSLKPEKLQYHDKAIEFRHYGKNIALMLEKAVDYEDGPEKDSLVHAIAQHMKKSYLSWNRESVDDTLIEMHLDKLSKGKAKLKQDFKFQHTNEILGLNKKVRKPFRPSPNGKYNQRNKNRPQQ
ncbi:MAG: DUF4290 domain-containing protein [Bacteroidota bacterium]